MSRIVTVFIATLLVAACGGEAITPVATPTQALFPSGAPGQPGLPGQPGTTAQPGSTGQPGTTAQPGSPTPAPASGIASLIAASVQIESYEQGESGPVLTSSGSGTIISPDGLILTNAHVAAADAPGLAVQYASIGGYGAPSVALRVLMTEREDQPPVPRFFAEVVAVDGYLDIAVLRITTDAEGQPVSGLQLPAVQLGDSDAVRIGDSLSIVGFPGIGGDTVSVATGDVSGFLEDPKIGQRGWVKTSAIVHFGNSGGLAANSAGELVAVPTRAPDFDAKDPSDIGGYALLRPVNLAMPVIEAARGGVDYGPSRYAQPGTGQEQLQFVGWLPQGASGCDPSQFLSSYPTGTSMLDAAFSFSGFADGLDYAVVWFGQVEGSAQIERLDDRTGVWEFGPSGDCLRFRVGSRSGFANGVYGLLVGAGPSLQLIATAETTIGGTGGPGIPGGPGGPGPTPGPATPGPATPGPATPGPATPGPTLPTDPDQWIGLGGRVIDATTGRGVPEAFVVIFLPGVDPIAWLNDPNASNDVVLATAEADAEGFYVMSHLVPAQMQLPILVVARGYAAWDGTLTTGTSHGTIGDIVIAPGAP
jgi:S1-C subfamily serine protease